MRFRPWFAALSIVLLLSPNPQAWAWGVEGHRVIADIAWAHLSDATIRNLRPLLGNNDLASVSTWADDIRSSHTETGPWHYVDIAPGSGGYQAKDCPDDNCVVARIRIFASVLGDSQQPLAARDEALKYLVHFVGDLSQPMHAVGDARGGNDIPVTFFGSAQCGEYACNLHGVWDSDLISHTGMLEDQYATELDAMIAADHLKAGPTDPVVWANRSFQLAQQAWVAPNTDLGEAYYTRERPVVDRELALAGLRLAEILNQELGRRKHS